MAGLALVASAAVIATELAGAGTALAYAGPILLLLVPLLAGRYVGEERIARLARAVRIRRRRPAPSAAPAAAHRVPVLPRGGRLIAASLAVRPPPLSATG